MLEKNRKRRRNSTRGVHPTKEVELKVSVHQRRSRKTAGRSFKTGSGSWSVEGGGSIAGQIFKKAASKAIFGFVRPPNSSRHDLFIREWRQKEWESHTMREMKTSTITKKAQKKEEAGAQREEALEVRRGFTVSHRLKVSDKDRTWGRLLWGRLRFCCRSSVALGRRRVIFFFYWRFRRARFSFQDGGGGRGVGFVCCRREKGNKARFRMK